MEKKGLLVVSFGTSFDATREKTIDRIEADLSEVFSDRRFYRGWTSKMIIKKIKKRDGIIIDTVSDALERMAKDGIKDVLVQPTHILDGVENDLMKQDIAAQKEHFEIIRIGEPLLKDTDDYFAVVKAIMAEMKPLNHREALVFMGHGSDHSANIAYPALDYIFKDLGHKKTFIGTVEGYPALESVLRELKAYRPEIEKVRLAPLMIVAGDHATNDMAGDSDDSWKNQIQSSGFDVACDLKGLGEYDTIRTIFIAHAKAAKPLN